MLWRADFPRLPDTSVVPQDARRPFSPYRAIRRARCSPAADQDSAALAQFFSFVEIPNISPSGAISFHEEVTHSGERDLNSHILLSRPVKSAEISPFFQSKLMVPGARVTIARAG